MQKETLPKHSHVEISVSELKELLLRASLSGTGYVEVTEIADGDIRVTDNAWTTSEDLTLAFNEYEASTYAWSAMQSRQPTFVDGPNVFVCTATDEDDNEATLEIRFMRHPRSMSLEELKSL